MTQTLHFLDAASLQDLATLANRAKRVQDQGIRLKGFGSVLTTWVPVMTPAGTGSAVPAVLGLRTFALAENSDVDHTYELSAITERLAHMNPAETQLSLPPREIRPVWAAVSAPRSGWVPLGTFHDDEIKEAASAGISRVGEATGTSAGTHVIERVREDVWGSALAQELLQVDTPVEQAQANESVEIPSGMAFGAYSLGFLTPGGRTEVHQVGRWIRLSSAGGFTVARVQ